MLALINLHLNSDLWKLHSQLGCLCFLQQSNLLFMMAARFHIFFYPKGCFCPFCHLPSFIAYLEAVIFIYFYCRLFFYFLKLYRCILHILVLDVIFLAFLVINYARMQTQTCLRHLENWILGNSLKGCTLCYLCYLDYLFFLKYLCSIDKYLVEYEVWFSK